MRNALFTLLVFTLPVAGFSQTSIKVKEVNINMSKGMNNGFETEIPQAAVKEVEKDWKRRLTAGSKAKLTEANGEIILRGIDNKDIAPQPFNLYCILTSTEGGVRVTALFTYNDTTFFTTKSGKSEATSASRFVRDFAGAEYFLALKSAYHNEREKLEKMKDELEKSVRIQEKGNLKVSENKRAIARAQDDLLTNENDRKEAAAAINLQQAEVNKARSGNAEVYKAADKALKEQQDAEKKLKNRNEELHRKIDEWNKETTTEERTIATTKQDLAKTGDAIEKQKLLIKDLAAKLKAVK